MKYLKVGLRYIYYILFFFYSRKDFKYDFPFPPKPLSRLFIPQYYLRFFSYYYRKKKNQKKFSHDYNDYWKNNKWDQGSYLKWIKTIVNTHMLHIDYDNNIKKIFKNNPKRLLEIGSGSGHSAATILTYYLNFLTEKENDNKSEMVYYALELSKQRSETAKINLETLFGNQNSYFTIKHINENFLSNNFKEKFEYSFLFSVLETIDDNDIEKFVERTCEITTKGVYITDLNDKYPGGNPRSHKIVEKIFLKNNFKLSNYKYKSVTTKGFKNTGKLDLFLERLKY